VRRHWLGALLLAPLVLGGCGSSGGSSVTAAPTPSGSPWVVVANGSATPTPGSSRFTGTPSPYASGFLPLPSGTPTATPTPSPTCVPPNNGYPINFASVVPASTSAAVTFYNPGGASLVQYRVTAISEDLATGEQRDVGWTVLTPGTGCGFLTATVTGLDPKTHYQFSVDAVHTHIDNDGTFGATVARSGVVRTT
jgi:hypothetical protein